jgi:hypothetical protein
MRTIPTAEENFRASHTSQHQGFRRGSNSIVMPEVNSDQYKRSNAKLIRYCLVPATLAVIYGMGVAQTSGFLAMPE